MLLSLYQILTNVWKMRSTTSAVNSCVPTDRGRPTAHVVKGSPSTVTEKTVQVKYSNVIAVIIVL